MGTSTAIIMLVVAIAFFVMVFACIRKEKNLVGFYSQLGVCGRWYAFITGDFLLVGVGAPVACIVVSVMKLLGMMEDFLWVNLLSFLGAALVALPIGLLMLHRAQKKCPEALRGRLVKDMIIIMVGTSFRLGLFFMAFLIHAWWKANQPVAYEVDGKVYYAYPGSEELYDEYGIHRGKMNASHDRAIMD